MTETLEYRPVSHLSVVTLVLGVMSSLALVTPVLWIVPIAAIGIASLALRSLAKEPNLIGRKAALIGLALAVLFGVWPPIQLFTLRGLHVRQSQEVARQWLDLLRLGKVYEAHQITLQPHRRLRADMTLEEFYGSRVEWQERLGRFLQRDAIRNIVDAEDVRIRYLDTLDVSSGRWRGLAEHRFELIPANGQKMALRLSVQRFRDRETGDTDWLVDRVNGDLFESV